MANKLRKYMISFVIPVLNGEKYIGRCLDHIIREMDYNDEIIVVDNGSTDGTLKIVYRYEKVKVLKYPTLTIAALRNRGADIAKADILAFIDSDCLLCHGWRTAVESVMSDETVKATGSHYDVTLSPTWIEKAWLPPRRLTEIKANYIVSGNFVIRKEVFKAVSGFNEKLITDEDFEIGARLNKLGFCMIDAPQIRVIHLGNAKTLKEFVKKEKWHATSILNTMSVQKVDKPMVMTFVFMSCCLFSVFSLPFHLFYHLNPLVVLSTIFLSPLVTALYRVYEYRNYRYFFHLIILYFLFYLIRSISVMEALFKRYLCK
jgi:glycosyltransferase involved in cell wall biosynthesis